MGLPLTTGPQRYVDIYAGWAYICLPEPTSEYQIHGDMDIHVGWFYMGIPWHTSEYLNSWRYGSLYWLDEGVGLGTETLEHATEKGKVFWQRGVVRACV